MHLERSKLDKKDAKYLCAYGIERNPTVFQMPDQEYFECRSLNNSIETLTQKITSFTNKVHSLNKQNLNKKTVLKSYERISKVMRKEMKLLELELSVKLKEWHPELVELVRSVTGIGKRGTAHSIIATQGFKHTHSYQQLISFTGLSPREYSSATSVHGRVKIYKSGKSNKTFEKITCDKLHNLL